VLCIREGTIQVGDRLLGVEGEALTGLSLSRAEALLRGETTPGSTAWLTIEYDVTTMWGLRSSGPLLVEFTHPNQPHPLGVSLVDSAQGGVILSRVESASIAER
jgi:hypothetical protein